MLNRIAHLESVIESQKAQIHRQAEKINDIWKLLQGPSSACAFENHPPITVTPHSSSTLPLFTSSAFNVVPGISNGVLSTTTNHSPETHTQRGTKRKEPHSPSPRAKDVIKHKRRRSIRATSKFIKTLALSPINARDKANKYKKSTPSMMTSVTASVSTSSPTQNTHIMKSLSSAQKYQSIIQVLSPSSRVVSNKLSQCQTYTAVGKLIALEGSNATSIHDRFAVVCALGDKMTKQGSNTTNNRWYTNFLNSTGAIEVFVQWLHEFSKYFHKLLDEKMIIMTQYMNGFNANASGVMDRFKICGMTSQYVEVLIFIIEEAHWTASRVLSSRIDKIFKELYKSLTKYNKVITEKIAQSNKLSNENIEIVSLYAFQLLSIANLLKLPWEKFRKILQTADEEQD